MIEDAAQALGATQEGRQAGTLGACGAVSFFPSKNLGALGDAGALLTNDDELFERSRILRMHGMEPKYHHREVGGNFRIDALQAAFLAVKLPRLADYAAKRQSHAEAYRERLAPLSGLVLPEISPGHVWNQFTLRVPGAGRRDALRAHLAVRGIGAEIYYPVPLHEQACFACLGTARTIFRRPTGWPGRSSACPSFPRWRRRRGRKSARRSRNFFRGDISAFGPHRFVILSLS